ncbi:UNVERIFIED_CONTAM: NAC domain-containing protein 53 [Sesamum angustifolium]|uniref:NAC domain-containing protein 53 n=1 Tax=Sesamum angustifolium TaxID=2727405 RepID=A0AAW2PUM8_9LAMI
MGQEVVVGTAAKPGRMGAPPPTSLAPGFRFHPTDEELVRYYLGEKKLWGGRSGFKQFTT